MKKFLLGFCMVLLFVCFALAQTTAPIVFDPSIVDKILLGVAGLTVVGITEMIKRLLKVEGTLAYLISLAVSAAASAYFLISTASFAILPFIGYTVFVFLAANGIYKVAAKVETK